ncbi:MAG: asparagine synthase (glutamine-hydrolyzing) [Crocinitomicaceae bacterium]|nr:asparagine synthase (glutamine-hydrolyzing) [Crocinitomicaceae bacterium]|tara:strand:+ start:334 stop:2172 length:1839 start_codon:yes stop_codon:yes gene_type:complete
MCGITGFYSKNLKKDELILMTNRLRHRGPDAIGNYFNIDKHIGLGHSRLSILDLSDSANQPMTSSCNRYVMVYNGEVYNYKNISKEISKINWKTSSDSEVILEAFCKWGPNFVTKLNGMFSIAIYDKKENKLFLFRDRMGIKPLFYSISDDQFIFASELKAIDEIIKNKPICNESIYAYLHLGYIPTNKTIYKNILKVKPGSYIEYRNNELNETIYWTPENKITNNTFDNFSSSKKKLKLLLQNSIKSRLISDVPIGTFLSGGTDSSLVSAIAQEVSESTINTFSIGFEDAKHNESFHAKKVAKRLGTNHNEFILKEKDALNELESIMEHFDEPFLDPSALPTLLVSKMAKRSVTVCLSGDGGDELFMGYGAYNWAKRLSNPIIWSLKKPISSILDKSATNKYKRAGLVLNAPKKNLKSHIFSQEQYVFSERELNKLLIKRSNSLINELNQPYILSRKLNSIENQAFFDLNNYLIDDLLVKVDRASMYTSLEARVPLLDHNIIEFAINLNKRFKIHKGTQKYILKEILYDYLPKELMDRPKWGFSIPLDKWLQNELYFLIEKYLNKDIIMNQGILNYKEIEKIKVRFKNGETYLYNRLWSLIILNKFILNFG